MDIVRRRLYPAHVMALRLSVSVMFLIFSLKVFAYNPEEGKVTATIGPYFSQTNFSGSKSGAKAPTLGGLGFMVLGDINTKGSLEIAIFHMNKVFFGYRDDKYIGEQTDLVQVNMGYRRWFSPYFSGSLSFYSSYTIGDPRIVHNDFAPGTEIDTSAHDLTEYGFDFALQSEVWTDNYVAITVDTRYSYDVTPKQRESADHYGVFIGLRYVVQEGTQEKKK